MLNYEEARHLVERYLAGIKVPPVNETITMDDGTKVDPFDLIIIDDRTVEKPYGWIFFWNSRGHHFRAQSSSRDVNAARYAFAGGSIIVVVRETGELGFLGGAEPYPASLARYEERRFGRRFD